jgi:hypothetical protein
MKSRLLFALAAAALSTPAIAAAQVSDADRATARTLATQGQEALDKKDYSTAADRFSRADSLVHAPTLLLGLARAQAGLGKLVSAHEIYARIVREGVPAGAPPAFAKAVADARKELDALEPRMASVVLQVKGTAAPRVTLDGTPVPAAALGVNRPVDPGKHVVRVEADGFLPGEGTVQVAEGKSATLTIELKPDTKASTPVGPVAPGQNPPAAGQAPSDAKPSSTLRTVGFVGIGVGGAALAMGAITGGLALAKHGDLAKACPDGHCVNQQDALSSYHTMGLLSTIGFISGGAVAATGVVLAIVAPKPKPAKEARITPLVGPTFVGAQGRF